MKKKKSAKSSKKIRYAVVGLGHIAQVAVLPSFKHAKNSELVALVSEDPEKLETLGKKYKVSSQGLISYKDYPQRLHDLDVDAVYIATPNHLHLDFALDAIREGFHILCEKPLAISIEQCDILQKAAQRYQVKLMTAYRLHFEPSNLDTIKMACEDKELGELRFFNSTFTMQVKDTENIRLNPTRLGGGPLWDIGIYCINAVRGLFRAEPIEVFAMAESNGDPRFNKSDEMMSVTLRFPENRLASFIISFGADTYTSYNIVGTKGSITLDNAYEYAGEREMTICHDEEDKTKTYKKVDQFGPELVYFSNCILNDEDPEPGVAEGRADVKVIQAILMSLDAGHSIRLDHRRQKNIRYPDPSQKIQRPAVQEPETVNATAPSGD